jgi:1,4-dihydroxy-2-naphthoyl-CoA synthase
MQYETILVDVTDHIATITLNRPDAMNSFTRQKMTFTVVSSAPRREKRGRPASM